MIRKLTIIESWFATMILAAVVGYGASDRWVWLQAILFGLPVLIWSYRTWRRMTTESQAEYTLSFALRVFVLCLVSSFFIIGFVRGWTPYRYRDFVPLIGLVWMALPFLFFIQKAIDARRDLYQK